MFQHTAARRRLPKSQQTPVISSVVSTHSRAKAAAVQRVNTATKRPVSTHSRAKAAAFTTICLTRGEIAVSTHSRAKAAALVKQPIVNAKLTFQHTAARRRLLSVTRSVIGSTEFQHTAARRRLQGYSFAQDKRVGFNTQPREGGCSLSKKARKISVLNIVFR